MAGSGTRSKCLADIFSQDIKSYPYTCLIDANKLYNEELSNSKSDIENNLVNYVCKSFAPPGNQTNEALQEALKARNYLGARGGFSSSTYLLEDIHVYDIKQHLPAPLLGSTDAQITRNAAAFCEYLNHVGGIYVLYAHNEYDFSIHRWQVLLDVLAKSNVSVMTLSEAIEHIRNLRTGFLPAGTDEDGDGKRWTRTLPNQADYRLKSNSPCIDAGADLGLTHDFVQTPVPYGTAPDVGIFESPFVLQLAEIIGTWSSGIWYGDGAGSSWTEMTSDTTSGDIAAGDFTGDGKADIASCWNSGLWYQNGATLGWTKIYSIAPNRLTAGDITGDGRAEIIGTWDTGVWFWNEAASSWTSMTGWVTTGDIAAGDITGDGRADVASCWPGYGLYYQNGATFGWQRITTSTYIPSNVAVGDLTGDGKAEVIGTFADGIWYWNPSTGSWKRLTGSGYVTDGDIAADDITGDGYADIVSCWSNGLWVVDGKTGVWTKVYATAPYRVTAGDLVDN